MDGLRFQI